MKEGSYFKLYRLCEEPYYLPIKDEIEIFKVAYDARLPVLLKGPTGCGKTRFVEYMAYTVKNSVLEREFCDTSDTSDRIDFVPLITVACHEDLTASDLIGRYLIEGSETVWLDGPLTKAVKTGAICYLDEIVEARKDTTVLIHPLADHRKILPVEKKGQIIQAHPDFLLVISYNPGYQSILKDLKQSTRQRFIAIDFEYPPMEKEAEIINHESAIDMETSLELAQIGEKVRNLREHGLDEGVSTRLLIYAGIFIGKGIDKKRACDVAITKAITDDKEMQQAITEIISTIIE